MANDIKVLLDELRQLPEHGGSVWHELKDISVAVFLTLGQYHTRHRQEPNMVEPPELPEQLIQFAKSWREAVKLVPALRTVLPGPLRLKAVQLGEHFLLTRSR